MANQNPNDPHNNENDPPQYNRLRSHRMGILVTPPPNYNALSNINFNNSVIGVFVGPNPPSATYVQHIINQRWVSRGHVRVHRTGDYFLFECLVQSDLEGLLRHYSIVFDGRIINLRRYSPQQINFSTARLWITSSVSYGGMGKTYLCSYWLFGFPRANNKWKDFGEGGVTGMHDCGCHTTTDSGLLRTSARALFNVNSDSDFNSDDSNDTVYFSGSGSSSELEVAHDNHMAARLDMGVVRLSPGRSLGVGRDPYAEFTLANLNFAATPPRSSPVRRLINLPNNTRRSSGPVNQVDRSEDRPLGVITPTPYTASRINPAPAAREISANSLNPAFGERSNFEIGESSTTAINKGRGNENPRTLFQALGITDWAFPPPEPVSFQADSGENVMLPGDFDPNLHQQLAGHLEQSNGMFIGGWLEQQPSIQAQHQHESINEGGNDKEV
uniref:DUF4283 domain-containing protein n=1 Tax=Chenopodium quinoa TaxID=63459 RepID=A0A803LZW7_CHEQI